MFSVSSLFEHNSNTIFPVDFDSHDGGVSETSTEVEEPVPLPTVGTSQNVFPAQQWSFRLVENLPENIKPWNSLAYKPYIPARRGTDLSSGTPISAIVPSAIEVDWMRAISSEHSHVRTDSEDSVVESPVATRGRGVIPLTEASLDSLNSTTFEMSSMVGSYRCVYCKEWKNGVRFVMTQDHRGSLRSILFTLPVYLNCKWHRKTTLPVLRSAPNGKTRI